MKSREAPNRRAHIAFLCPGVSLWENPGKFNFFNPMNRALMDEAPRLGCQISWLDSMSGPVVGGQAKGWARYDGVLALVPWRQGKRDPMIRLPPGLPRVNLLFPVPREPYVGTDESRGLDLLIAHLQHRGYRRLGYFSLSRQPYGPGRYLAFRQAVESRGSGFDPRLVFGVEPGTGVYRPVRLRMGGARIDDPYEAENLHEVFEAYWESGRPEAIVFESDKAARRFARWAQARGLRIPQAVAICGFDNDPEPDAGKPWVTTVDQDFGAIARAGLEGLLGLLGKRPGTLPPPLLLPPHLIIRRSTEGTTPREAGQSFVFQVGKAVREQLGEAGLSHRLAGALGMNRAYFLRKYQAEAGESFVTTVNRERLDGAVRLLKDTGLSITRICQECGFGTHQNFNRLFKARHGLGAEAWRAAHRYQ